MTNDDMIPRSEALAMVAAAFKAASHEVRGSNLGLDIGDIADDVEALTDADAAAALEAVKEEAMKEGMRLAASVPIEELPAAFAAAIRAQEGEG